MSRRRPAKNDEERSSAPPAGPRPAVPALRALPARPRAAHPRACRPAPAPDTQALRDAGLPGREPGPAGEQAGAAGVRLERGGRDRGDAGAGRARGSPRAGRRQGRAGVRPDGAAGGLSLRGPGECRGVRGGGRAARSWAAPAVAAPGGRGPAGCPRGDALAGAAFRGPAQPALRLTAAAHDRARLDEAHLLTRRPPAGLRLGHAGQARRVRPVRAAQCGRCGAPVDGGRRCGRRHAGLQQRRVGPGLRPLSRRRRRLAPARPVARGPGRWPAGALRAGRHRRGLLAGRAPGGLHPARRSARPAVPRAQRRATPLPGSWPRAGSCRASRPTAVPWPSRPAIPRAGPASCGCDRSGTGLVDGWRAAAGPDVRPGLVDERAGSGRGRGARGLVPAVAAPARRALARAADHGRGWLCLAGPRARRPGAGLLPHARHARPDRRAAGPARGACAEHGRVPPGAAPALQTAGA